MCWYSASRKAANELTIGVSLMVRHPSSTGVLLLLLTTLCHPLRLRKPEGRTQLPAHQCFDVTHAEGLAQDRHSMNSTQYWKASDDFIVRAPPVFGKYVHSKLQALLLPWIIYRLHRLETPCGCRGSQGLGSFS